VNTPPDLFNIPSEYYKFANILSQFKTKILTPHYLYNLKINLEEGIQPLVGTIYSILISKQEILKKFIEENFNIDFIWPTSFLHSALILFFKKKDRSVLSRSLTVDFIFYFLFSLYFIFIFIFYFILFSIFRTTRVRVYQSRCNISHKVMTRSQDWSQDLGEWSRRFWNKVTSYNIDNTCWPHDIHMVIRVGCTVVSTDHE